jgi:hypothetical protein
MKSVTTKSKIKGWQARLHEVYFNYDEFERYSDTYGIAARLGYDTPEIAWNDNPLICGSIRPEDLCVVVEEDA